MDLSNFKRLKDELAASGARLVAVSKTKPVEAIHELYDAGQRSFGENYVQELVKKQPLLPSDVEWHFIGHLQRNKVKQIVPFVSLVHSVDSEKLLNEIDRQAAATGRVIRLLLQFHAGTEESKFGLKEDEVFSLAVSSLAFRNISVNGLMMMASNTDSQMQIEDEFRRTKHLFNHLRESVYQHHPSFCELSMGMTADYRLALRHGATLVRIGSLIFGDRG